MRDYGKVHSTFWSSQTTGGMSDDGKMLALYLMTCTHSTIAGVFRLPDGYVSEDLGWSPERVAKGFAELFAKGFANRCETTKWVWITKHLEWNPPENPNQRKAAVKVAASIPAECVWKQDFMRASAEVLALTLPEESNPSETVQEGFRNQKQEQKQEQEKETSSLGAAKPRPTRKCPDSFLVTVELQQWAREEVPAVDIRAETKKFRDHTFKDSKTDWPATWRNWMRTSAEKGKPAGSQPSFREGLL